MPKLLFESIKEPLNKDELIPLCLWSFLSSEESLSSDVLESMVFLNHSHQENATLNHHLNKLIDHVFLPDIADWLNLQHHTTHSLDYWKILLSPWMGFVVNTSYYYFLLLQKYIERYPNKPKVCLFQIDSDWEFKDTHHFIFSGINTENFHRYLITEVLRSSFNDDITIENITPFSPPLVDVHNGFESVRDHRSRRCINVPGMSTLSELFLSLLLRFKSPIDPPTHDPMFLPKGPLLEIDEALRSCITDILKRSIPLSFTRYFFDYQKRARKIRYKKGKLRVFGAISSTFEQMKYYLANAKEHSEILMTTQHGGNYGWHLSHREPFLFEYRFHYFITWGWALEPDCFATKIPLPSPYMCTFKNRHRFKSNHIVFIGTDMNPFLTSCIPSFHEGKKLLEYRKDKLKFLKNLPKNKLKEVLYRAYPQKENRFSDSQFLLQHLPELSLLTGNRKDLHQALFKAQLCVMDHLGSSLLVCLSANVPFICFWRPEYCDLNSESILLVKAMKKENLYFETPQEAAQFVSSLDDIQAWWQTKQEFRNHLMTLHANHSPWFLAWVKKLWAL